MGTPAQVIPGYYVWQVPGKPVVVHLNLNVVDRLSAEIMRGYGAVPKRGAEVGGVLIGTIEEGTPGQAAIVKVEDFTAVPCNYRRGPSYLFSEEDGASFQQAYAKPGVIGYFRSHTRDGLSLAAEDFELLDHFFSGPGNIAMLVKPLATKASMASFFVRENGVFVATPALEFPFRRRELMGEEPPPRRSLIERGPRRRERPLANQAAEPAPDYNYAGNEYSANEYPSSEYQASRYQESDDQASDRFNPPEPAYAYTTPAKARLHSWYWIPLSFVFLMLGVFLGFQIALFVGPRVTRSGVQDFSLDLSVAKSGDNLNVKWDRQSAAVRAAPRGTLEIEDKGTTKPVELDAAQLQNGALIYSGSSNSVRFRLTVYPDSRVSVSETVEWKAVE
jgi:hypothetical protein